MKLIVISNPKDVAEEIETIHSLFEKGLDCFHLRKPEKNANEFEELLKKIYPLYYKRIVIHSHYTLISKYNLRGIHIPEALVHSDNIKDLIKTSKKRGLTVSASLHSIESVLETKGFDYVFLSPVFDSISKHGYTSKIDPDAFKEVKSKGLFSTKVIGLGGVDKNNIHLIQNAGFDGAAVLGAIWLHETKEERVKEFAEIKSLTVSLTERK